MCSCYIAGLIAGWHTCCPVLANTITFLGCSMITHTHLFREERPVAVDFCGFLVKCRASKHNCEFFCRVHG
ncbi:unnamed protein product [Ixodes persulcatus]